MILSPPLIAIVTVELTHFVNARPNSMLERAIVKAVLSVCPSVRHNRDSGLNGLRCRNTQSEIERHMFLVSSTFLTPNFVVLNFGVCHPNKRVKENIPI